MYFERDLGRSLPKKKTERRNARGNNSQQTNQAGKKRGERGVCPIRKGVVIFHSEDSVPIRAQDLRGRDWAEEDTIRTE